MAGNDTIQLQRAIFSQYIMMKNLFMELEEEREASATAASAAMSMIRKLQKEKDAERMEAWQYKRIAEEKMNHSDRALEILKEVMEQKELEVSYLRNQLQVYKHKLLNVGINDCDIADATIANNIPLFGNKTVEGLCQNIKRNISLPTLQLNELSANLDRNMNEGVVQSLRSSLDGHMCYLSDNECEQVSRDVKASEPKKILSTDMNSKEKHGEDLHSPGSVTLHHSHPLESLCSSFLVVNHQTDIGRERVGEVREDVEGTLHCDQPKDSSLGTEVDETAVHPTSDVLDIPERNRTSTDFSCAESHITTEESELSPKVVPKERGSHTLSRLSATRKVGSMNNVDRHVRLSSGSRTSQAGVERTRSRLKRVQSEKMVELNDPKTNKEQIIMLKEVYGQLNMIESHMKPSGSHESPRNDASLDSVLEAALSFSI